MKTNKPMKKYLSKVNGGFTLIEMMVIAPIVILVIGVFVTAIVSMTGQVLSTRGSNFLTLSINDALDKINQDVKTSSSFLATNSFTPAEGQGYLGDNDNQADQTYFDNVDASKGDMLILNTYATTKNPLDSTRNFVYAINQPYACNNTLVSQNAIVMVNIVYFVKNGTLWRRMLLPSNYSSIQCSTPWQLPSCTPGNGAAFCKTSDMALVSGNSDDVELDLSYYNISDPVTPIADASDESITTDSIRQVALNSAVSVKATITATKTIAGRKITQTSNMVLTRNLKPSAVAPLADWVATPQDSHSGNFYDQVSKTWATITASGTKTIFDPRTSKAYAIPASTLGIGPRSDGKSGYEAQIEDAATNYLLHSSFEGVTTGWTYQTAGYGSAAASTDRSAYGTYSLKITRTATGGEANVYQSMSGLTANTSYNYSVYAWASQPGAACIYTYLGTTNIAKMTVCHNGDSTWQKLTGTFVSSATGTIQLRLGDGDTASGPITSSYYDCAQIELGTYATSYIPTVGATVARVADVVTVPTVSNYNYGTVFAVFSKPDLANRGVYSFGGDGSNWIGLYCNTASSISAYAVSANTFRYGHAIAIGQGYNVAYWRWNTAGANYGVNGIIESQWIAWDANFVKPIVAPSITRIGASHLTLINNQISTPIQRVVVYNSSLTDADIIEISNTLKNGT